MGKSDKKIKSDRINSLRKKYDTFLEEDKKRKERNEYILEKLDKMRYCAAVVPVHQKPTILTESQTATFHNKSKHSVKSPTSLPYSDQRLLNLEMSRNNDDNPILQEISKKYILIPKLRTTNDDYASIIDTNSKTDDNTDWKSKYQILEQLKRDEKEQDSATRKEIFQADHDKTIIDYKDSIPKDDSQMLLEYNNKIPDHSLSKKQLSYNLQNYTNNKEKTEGFYDKNVNEILKTSKDKLENYTNENTKLADALAENENNKLKNYDSIIDYNVPNQTKSTDNTETSDENIINNSGYVENVDETISSPELDNVIKMTQENPVKFYPKADVAENTFDVSLKSDFNEQSFENEFNGEEDVNQEPYSGGKEVTFVQDVHVGDLKNVINDNFVPDSDLNVTAISEYPVETVNVQNFTPRDDVQLQDGVNINPEAQVVAQDDLTYNYDPVVQNENAAEPTITSESTQENYTEQADQNYDYTEESVVDNCNTEYAAPNENYEQNEYAYYEGAQTEQAYPEANDSEETSQRYDQNYEQQYGAVYNQEAYPQQGYEQGFEQPEYADQMQHYEAPDQAQRDLEKLSYEEIQENITLQYVEQQLDHEQGYGGKQDETIDINNVENPAEKHQNVIVDDQQVQ